MPRYICTRFPLEKLIAEVRRNPFLYDPNHPEYKSLLKKAETWRDIAKKFNDEPKDVKMKWRNCRDSYLKYKRALKDSNSVYVTKNKEWPWSSHMRFLDGVLELNPPKPNSRRPGGNNESRTERRSPPSSPRRSESPASEGPSHDDCGDNILLSSTQKTRKNATCNQCVVSYLENKQKAEDNYDEVDHLFQSYAKTFKRFTPRSQANLKVQLAQLFADTELAELDEQRPRQSSSSLSVQNSVPTNLTEISPSSEFKSISMTEL